MGATTSGAPAVNENIFISAVINQKNAYIYIFTVYIYKDVLAATCAPHRLMSGNTTRRSAIVLALSK